MFRSAVAAIVIGIGLVAIIVYEANRTTGPSPSDEETELHGQGVVKYESAASSVSTGNSRSVGGNNINIAERTTPASAAERRADPVTSPPAAARKEEVAALRKSAPNLRSGPEARDPSSVVGRRFQISNSVLGACREEGCPELDQALAKFAAEPRDPAWAPMIEEKLHQFITIDPQFAVRNVECRETLCFAEVTSIMGPYVDGVKVNGSPDKLLFMESTDFGFERDPSSGRVTVTLVQFSRR